MIFRYTILYVDDVPATLDFYERAFGLKRGFLHESGDYGEMATGETKLAFSSTTLMRQLGKDPAKPAPKAPVFELAFEADDVPAALALASPRHNAPPLNATAPNAAASVGEAKPV